MIKADTNAGKYSVTGRKIDLLIELTMILRIMLREEVIDNKELEEAIRLAKLSDEEAKKEALDSSNELMEERLKSKDDIIDFLNSITGEKDD